MRTRKFRALDNGKLLSLQNSTNYAISRFFVLLTEKAIVMESTGFLDKNGNEIFEGDNLTDVVETDEGNINTKYQVFWNKKMGSWHLDLSRNQDKTESSALWLELNDYEYETIQPNSLTKAFLYV
jgi:hypothetical protein